MAALGIRRFASVESFLEVGGPFLGAREAEHNLQLGIAGTLRDHPDVYPDPPYLAVVMDADAVVLAAMRTPPWSLVLSESERPDAVDLLVVDLHGLGGDLPGVEGPPGVARRFAEGWTDRTGRRARLDISERIYRLTRVIPPSRSVAGRWREAGPDDHGLLVGWLRAFQDEALPASMPSLDLDVVADRWIARVGRWMGLWEVDGRVVSMVGVGSRTPNGIRIGPVYTPPADRGRGYASALTAAASQAELDAGRRFCFLFADLANPTSNRIYQAIGYQPVTDVDRWAFG